MCIGEPHDGDEGDGVRVYSFITLSCPYHSVPDSLSISEPR